jgi:hypothetical protein
MMATSDSTAFSAMRIATNTGTLTRKKVTRREDPVPARWCAEPSQEQEHEHGHDDRAHGAEGLAHEHLDLDPGQSPQVRAA